MRDTHIHWDEINYASLISQTLRNLWVTVLCVLSAILLYVGLARLTYTPKYMSTATLMVGAKDSTNAYNSLTTPRHQLAEAMEAAGFTVLPQAEGLEHRVDQAILRDVLVARK